jgi:DNA-binding transcriptional LysR family regulator
MELRHLRYFVAVGEEENYRRAAQRLNVAQTALSTQIQDLEAELGFKLFDRLPRGVKLSAAGKLFLEDARREGLNEATTLSLVSHGMGVGWVNGSARWRCPESVVIVSVVDLDMPLPLGLVWRRDNTSPLLANFIGEVQRLPDVRAASKRLKAVGASDAAS